MFLHKIFLKLGPVWNVFLNPNFYFFFDFWSDFWYPRNGNCLLFVSVVIIIIFGTTCFLFKAIIFCKVFLPCPFSQNISVRYSISSVKYFSEQILVALAKNSSNMLVIVSGGIQECGLICTLVRAGLRCTSNSYLPLLFFILMFKGYLRYKTITSQNVPSKAQIKNFFIS